MRLWAKHRQDWDANVRELISVSYSVCVLYCSYKFPPFVTSKRCGPSKLGGLGERKSLRKGGVENYGPSWDRGMFSEWGNKHRCTLNIRRGAGVSLKNPVVIWDTLDHDLSCVETNHKAVPVKCYCTAYIGFAMKNSFVVGILRNLKITFCQKIRFFKYFSLLWFLVCLNCNSNYGFITSSYYHTQFMRVVLKT